MAYFTHPREQYPFRAEELAHIRFEGLAKTAAQFTGTHPVELLVDYRAGGVKEYMWGNMLEGPIRSYVEPVGADDQCTRAGIPFISGGNTPCWLCGCIIQDGEEKACEHILPALRAVMLTGMITTAKVLKRPVFDTFSSDIKNYSRINYLWAHADCNGSSGKSGMVLITHSTSVNGQYFFVPDEKNCAELQRKILAIRKGKDCYLSLGGSNIYTELVAEMQKHCDVINSEYSYFIELCNARATSDGIVLDPTQIMNRYIEYTLSIIKAYASEEALEKLLTDEQLKGITEAREAEKDRLMQEGRAALMAAEQEYNAYRQSTAVVHNQVIRTLTPGGDMFSITPDDPLVEGYIQSIVSITSYNMFGRNVSPSNRGLINFEVVKGIMIYYNGLLTAHRFKITPEFFHALVSLLTLEYSRQCAVKYGVPFNINDTVVIHNRTNYYDEAAYLPHYCNGVLVLVVKLFESLNVPPTDPAYLTTEDFLWFEGTLREYGVDITHCKGTIVEYMEDLRLRLLHNNAFEQSINNFEEVEQASAEELSVGSPVEGFWTKRYGGKSRVKNLNTKKFYKILKRKSMKMNKKWVPKNKSCTSIKTIRNRRYK